MPGQLQQQGGDIKQGGITRSSSTDQIQAAKVSAMETGDQLADPTPLNAPDQATLMAPVAVKQDDGGGNIVTVGTADPTIRMQIASGTGDTHVFSVAVAVDGQIVAQRDYTAYPIPDDDTKETDLLLTANFFPNPISPEHTDGTPYEVK